MLLYKKLGDLDWTHVKISARSQSKSAKGEQGFEIAKLLA